MKYLSLFLAIFIFLTIFYLKYYPQKQSTISNPLSNITNSPSPKKATIINLDNKNYQIYLQKIIHPKNLALIPNFIGKKTSRTIFVENKCIYGINAGFYTADDKPLGLMFTQNKYLNDKSHDSLMLNGYFYKTKTNEIDITYNIPKNELDFIFQSGPLFFPNSKLKIIDDDYAKRSLIGKTDDNDFYFLVIVDDENFKNGPLLTNLPRIITELNKNQNTKFSTLLNLDGGSASSFFDDSGNALEELTYVGSFICGK